MNNLFDLSGKTALVTGASKGIGEMIATGLLQSGVKTYICSRKEDELFYTQEKLSQYGQCLAICADLSTYEGVAALASKIKESEPKLSILINNAGATWGASLEDFPETGWDKVMNLNVKSLFYLTTALLPSMRLARHQMILLESSTLGLSMGCLTLHYRITHTVRVKQLFTTLVNKWQLIWLRII